MSGGARQMRAFLDGLDRGQVLRARVVQVKGRDVHVVLGPGSFWARAHGGHPQIGWHRLEVVRPGERPILKLIDEKSADPMSIVIDPSHEKAYRSRGVCVDRQA